MSDQDHGNAIVVNLAVTVNCFGSAALLSVLNSRLKYVADVSFALPIE